MHFVLEASYWILFFAVMIFAVIGLKRWYKKLGAALIVTALGLYIGMSWYKQRATERAEMDRLQTSQSLERAAGEIRTRIDYLTREALDFEFERSQGPATDRSAELKEMRATLDIMHLDAVRVSAFGPRMTIESLERQLESLKSLTSTSRVRTPVRTP